MSWEAVTAVSTAIMGLVIAVTAFVGFDQLRQIREQRRDSATVELVRTFQDIDFTRAVGLVFSLPRGISATDLRARGSECEEAARLVGLRFESLGLLVFRRAVSFEVTEELIGGAVVNVWERLRDTIRETRETQQYPSWMEWFQWLAEQFMKQDRQQETPAHVRHRDDWSPGHP
jgi:hypothetical protein